MTEMQPLFYEPEAGVQNNKEKLHCKPGCESWVATSPKNTASLEKGLKRWPNDKFQKTRSTILSDSKPSCQNSREGSKINQ